MTDAVLALIIFLVAAGVVGAFAIFTGGVRFDAVTLTVFGITFLLVILGILFLPKIPGLENFSVLSQNVISTLQSIAGP